MSREALFRMLLLVALVTFASLLLACSDDDDDDDDVTSSATADASLSETPDDTGTAGAETEAATTAAAEPTVAATFVDVCEANPAPATVETNVVDSPAPGDEVTSPLTISGEIAAFEAAYRATLFDANGGEMADAAGQSEEGQTLAPFELELSFGVSEPVSACLWVYESSAMDGSPVNVVQVPVLLLP